jgi:protein involved in polysaccharide export with SLBB domain
LRLYLILALVFYSTAFSQEIKPHFDQPVQAEKYIVRPGDELTVTFLKANIEPLKLTVDPEGRIIHNNLGRFDLYDKTLAETKEILRTAIKALYKVENVVISITDPLLVSFTITGAVVRPGSYQGYTSQRVSDAIKMAGGIKQGGSSRRIQFIGGPEEIIVDLDLANSSGELKFDPCLYMGYKIFVPQMTGSRVQVIGEVNNPREIELLPSDNLELLIGLAGGFRFSADSANIQLIRNGNPASSGISGIAPGDIIKVNAHENIPEFQSVAIFGAINKPGRYKPADASTLAALLALCGGYSTGGVKNRTTVFRFSPTDATGRISVVRIPIQNLSEGTLIEGSFTLQAGDSVFVPFSVGFVEVSGQVQNPGLFPHVHEKTAEYYISQAGGFLPEADRTQIGVFDSISRITHNVSPKVKVHDGCKIVVEIRKELK